MSRQASNSPRRQKNRRLRIAAWTVIAVCALIGAVIELGGSSGAAPAAASSSAAQTPATATPQSKAADACTKRKAGGDLYVRTTEPGLQAQAQEIGGEWQWDAGQCLDAVTWTARTAGTATGECTTIGYVAGNPGYDANATPARPLKNVAASAGPGC